MEEEEMDSKVAIQAAEAILDQKQVKMDSKRNLSAHGTSAKEVVRKEIIAISITQRMLKNTREV